MPKTIINFFAVTLLLFCCYCGKGYAQVIVLEDFEDNDMTLNPAWAGPTGFFPANATSPVLAGTNSLRSVTSNANKNIRLQNVINFNASTTTWRFLYRNTSNADAASTTAAPATGGASWRLWVASDGTSPSNPNGYALIHNGNTLQLKKYTNGVLTSDLLSYTFGAVANYANTYTIKLTRSTNGLWTLYVNTGTGEATTSAGSTTDVSYFNSGSATVNTILEACDGGTSGRFVWDNLKITQSQLTVGYNTNGITTSSTIIYPGATSYPIYSFQLTATDDLYLKYIDIAANADMTSAFGTLKVYRSTDNVYDGGDSDVSGSFSQLTVNSTYLRFYNNSGYLIPDGLTYYYFIIATSQASYTTVPSPTTLSISSTASIGGVTGSFVAIDNTGFTTNAYSHSSPSPLTFGALKDWTGGTDQNFSNSNNWSPGGVPGTTDKVRIGVLAITRQPIVNTAFTFGSLVFGTSNGSITLTANADLTVSGDVTVTSNLINNCTLTLAGSANKITVGGAFYVGDGTTPANNKTFSLVTTVGQLLITGDLKLTSSFNGSQTYFTANFGASSGIVSFANLVTANTGVVTSTLSTTSATLNLTGATPFGTLSSTGTNTITLGSASTVGYTGTIDQTVYTAIPNSSLSGGVTYPNIAFSGSGNKNVQSGAFSATGTLTTSGTPTVDFSGNTTTIAVTGITTIGTGSTIKQGAGAYTQTGAFINNGTFTGGVGTATLNGNYTNSDTFTPGTGTVIFNSASAQALIDNSVAGTTFNNVTFQNGGTKTMSGTGTFAVSSTGVLTMAGTTQLATGSKLTLKSDASGSAAVAAVPTGATITGNVTAQRYVTGGTLAYRGYRLFSSPVYEGAAGGNNVYGVAYTKNSAYVTGTTGTTGGFDATAATPTIYLYREDKAQSSSPTGGNFRGINAINNSPTYNLNLDNETGLFNIPVGSGFMFFFRGNRATNASTITTVVPDAATFSNTGTLNTGTITVKNWYSPGSSFLGYTSTAATYSKGFNLVGNPYASTIDWGTFTNSNAASGIYGPNIANATYVYNAALKSYAVWNGASGTNNATRYIPSGQGFFVLATAVSPSLNFKEIAKVPTQQVTGVNLFMGTPVVEEVAPQFVRVQLIKDAGAKEDIVLQFNKSATDNFVLGEDLPYMRGSSAVSLSSFAVDNKETSLAINQVPFPKKSVSVPLNVLTNATGIYQLALTEAKNIPQMFDVWLMDAYKKDSLDIKHNATYNFNVTATDATTFGADRFKLVVRPNFAYSYHLLDFTAVKQSTSVQISWKVENEENYTYFTVERSTDGGKTFNVIGSAVGKSQGTYSLEDKAPATGENQYRLKQEDYFGTITYSKIVSVMYEPAKTDENIVTVFPNPASTNISVSIKIESTHAVPYNISITNTGGRVVKTITSPQPVWQGNVSDLLPGTYFVMVTRITDKSVVGRSTFIKL